jgi:hypothetical protein
MPKIIDVIHHFPKSYNGEFRQDFVVLDKLPEFLYEKKGVCLIASDDGFYDCLFYDTPGKNWKAFAGREFDLKMKDGTIIHASGQWWDGKHQENAPEPIVRVGIGTIEGLGKCNVFSSGHISKVKYEEWLSKNTPSNDYYKYK